MVRHTVGGAGGFEERRIGEHFKLALPLQLKNGAGITRDISSSGIFAAAETRLIFRADGNWFKSFDTVNKRAELRMDQGSSDRFCQQHT